MKRAFVLLLTIVCFVSLLGGCMVYSQPEEPQGGVSDTTGIGLPSDFLPSADENGDTTTGRVNVTTTRQRNTRKTTSNRTTTKTTASTTATEYKPVSSGTWKQERFYLSSCICPADRQGLINYKEAGYNLLEWAFSGEASLKSALEICDELGGLWAVPWNAYKWSIHDGITFNENFVRNAVLDYDQYECIIGYTIWDEITPGENNENYKQATRMINYLDKWDPAALKYMLLFPSYGIYTWSESDIEFSWKSGNYEDYVDDYLRQMDPQVLAFDYYPYLMGTAGDTSDWHRDMGLFRKKALEYGKPFWYYYQACQVNGHGATPTDAQIRYQMYYGLACGAKELSAWNATEDALADGDTNSKLFKAAKARNKEIMAVGTYLFDKTSTHYYHTGAAANYQEEFYLDDLSKSSLIASAPDRVIMSVFTDGKTDTDYLLVVNKNTEKAMTGTLTLKSNKTISYFDHATEKEVAVGSGNSISLDIPAGCGRVYVLK